VLPSLDRVAAEVAALLHPSLAVRRASDSKVVCRPARIQRLRLPWIGQALIRETDLS